MEYNNVYYGDAYCVKCKEKVDFTGEIKVSDSGRRMAMGKCPECGTKVNRILGKEPFQEKPVKVPEPPAPLAPEPYATISVEMISPRKWRAYVRGFPGRDLRFYGRTKERAVRKAKKWIDGYEVIKVYK